MDDTIFDHALTSESALRALQRQEPVFRRRSLLEIWREYLRLLEAAHPRVVAGEISVEESRIARFRSLAGFCGATVGRERASELAREYRTLYRKLRRPVPGARGVLERIHRSASVGVVSNNRVEEQEEKLSFLGLGPFIDFMIISEAAGCAKPDTRIFELALERGRASPRDAVMIGDSWENDVLGARSAGIRAVWFNRFGATRPAALDVTEVDSFRRPAEVERILLAPSSRTP